MKMRKLLALAVAIVMTAGALAGCTTATESAPPTGTTQPTATPDSTQPTVEPTGDDTPAVSDRGHRDPKDYTFNDYTTAFGVDWNPHDWQTNGDSSVLSYLSSGLYEFKFNDERTSAELAPFMATSDPIDVTSKLTAAQKAQYGIPADATDSYAYQYPLRNDVRFEDGTLINAQTYVDSMKLLLDPERKNGRVAEQISGETPIAGASGYYAQGTISYAVGNASYDMSTGVYYSMSQANGWWGDSLQSALDDGYGGYLTDADGVNLAEKWDAYILANGGYNDEGYGRIADGDIAEFEADWSFVTNSYGGGYDGEWKEFAYVAADFTDAKYADFNNVGVIVDDEFTVTFVYAVKVTPFNAKYYQTSTWLVHPGLYEQYSKYEGSLLTTAYMTSKETSISYGPYSLASYEPDKEMLYVRNESWFGYNMPAMDDAYQPDAVRVKLLSGQATALLSFLKGEIDGTALVATDLADYGTSQYLMVSPNTYLYRFFYNLGIDQLKALDADDSSNVNTVALLNKNFRLAISAGIDRNEYTKITNAQPAFAMLNDLYTYDYEGEMADGEKYRYRDLDAAKEAILNVYDIKWGAGTEFATLDMAVDSVTGYDPEYANELMKLAFTELSADKDTTGFDPSKPVHIKLGYMKSAIDPTALAVQAEVNAKMAAAIAGSGFVGFEFEFVSDDDRYGAIKEGRLAVSFGAVGGARQDPWGITRAFLDPEYSVYLGANIPNDSVAITATFDEKTETTETRTLYDWYVALVGDYLYASIETKAQILSQLESYYLKQGYTTPLQSGVDTQLRSIRAEYPLDEYDPILGFGGLQYVTLTMDDAEWAAYVNANVVNGSLPYK